MLRLAFHLRGHLALSSTNAPGLAAELLFGFQSYSIPAFAFLAAAFPIESQAQVDDHLKCHKIRNTANFQVEVDLLSQQFGG